MFFFHITVFNSLRRIKKENTNSFEMLINSFFFLIVPSSLLKNCKLQDHLKPSGLKGSFVTFLEPFEKVLSIAKIVEGKEL